MMGLREETGEGRSGGCLLCSPDYDSYRLQPKIAEGEAHCSYDAWVYMPAIVWPLSSTFTTYTTHEYRQSFITVHGTKLVLAVKYPRSIYRPVRGLTELSFFSKTLLVTITLQKSHTWGHLYMGEEIIQIPSRRIRKQQATWVLN